ncbi:MAG: hypothetical protein U7123_08395 [Potamolinea sp.]
MVNQLRPGDDDLVFVDYSDLLTQILAVLQNPQTLNPFSISSENNRLIIDIDTIATEVANQQVNNPLGATAFSPRAATVNFSPGFCEQFPNQIQALKTCLITLLDSVLTRSSQKFSREQFVTSLIRDLQTFQGNASFDFTYPFSKNYELQKQRLTLEDSSNSNKELLKFHKLAISVQNTSNFNTHLKQGLANYINIQFADASESEKEDLGDILDDLEEAKENPKSDFYTLREIVDTETLGKLKKQAQINYLEFLAENINTSKSSTNNFAAIYLQDLIRRLKLINQYISDLDQPDGHYQVNYAGVSINYRDMFNREEAFRELPILPIVEGYLGETKDEIKGEIQFIFGLKIKLDGKVQTDQGQTVFEYYLNQLDPDSEEHREELADTSRKDIFVRKVLKLAFLYYFVFACDDPSVEGYTPSADLKYDPRLKFERSVLPQLKQSDEQVQNILRLIKKGFHKYNVQSKIKQLNQLMKNLMKRVTTFPTREYPLHISVKQSLLEHDISTIYNSNTFFKPVLKGNPKQVLKYIAIGEASAEKNSLLTLPAKITISDIHYFSTDEAQNLSMEYDIQGIKALPVLLVPKHSECRNFYETNFKKRNLLVFPYKIENNNSSPSHLFVYQFTFSLLAYISLNLLLDKRRLFIPILRLHLSKHEDAAKREKFMNSFSKVLSHLLNEKQRSNSQGIDLVNLTHKAPNVLSSLYSVLPKKFKFTDSSPPPQLDKLAIIIVSSRESDAKWNSSQKMSNLMGEIVGVRLQKDGSVRLQLLKTFSNNYNHQQLFTEPTVISDAIHEIYKLGFKHFVYIAKAPYSSTLHMTQTEDNDGLFFMSREVIRHLKADYDDIKIYPMFFDKYYVVKLDKELGGSSLYIQDTTELTNLVEDPSKQSAVFFNLFNGLVVGKADERHYNGVISYATLLNIYDGILDDQDIREGLLYEGSLKNDILQYLTLFHFSRYEKAKDIKLKLDPYENLIGENSVGNLSLFNHMGGKGSFNSLAFLTEVKKILDLAAREN